MVIGYVLAVNNNLTICLFDLPYNSNNKTIQFPITYKKKAFVLASQHDKSAYVMYIKNITLSSCVVTNYQATVTGHLMIIGI